MNPCRELILQGFFVPKSRLVCHETLNKLMQGYTEGKNLQLVEIIYAKMGISTSEVNEISFGDIAGNPL